MSISSQVQKGLYFSALYDEKALRTHTACRLRLREKDILRPSFRTFDYINNGNSYRAFYLKTLSRKRQLKMKITNT